MDGFTEVVSGVYVADGELPEAPVANPNRLPSLSPPEDVLDGVKALGMFFSASDFGQAGVDIGKSKNYGQGVMRDIALQMVSLEAEEAYTVNGKGRYLMRDTQDYDLYQNISMIMNNPHFVKRGSRNRLLLESDLVYEIWRTGASCPPTDYDVPRLGKVGHKVVSAIMLFRPDFIELKLASDARE